MDNDDDVPIEKVDYLYGMKVVNIDDFLIARGQSKRSYEKCAHRHMNYDTSERRIFCEDCKKTVSSFDAFVAIAEIWHKAHSQHEQREIRIKEAEKYNLQRLATKALDDEFKKHSTIPCCPHCNTGLLPDDFIGRRIKTTGKDIEIARRKRKEAEEKS